MLYLEDVTVGEVVDCGSTTVSREEIVAFAERYGPQPFHVDEAAAAESIFGGLVASGFHVLALSMRLIVDAVSDHAFAGARGVDELRWHRPLRPGTTLSVEIEMAGTDASGGPPGVGHVDFQTRGYDEDRELLITWTALGLMYERDATTSADGD